MTRLVITKHWTRRCAERLGLTAEQAETLAHELREAVQAARSDFVRYCGRHSRDGARLFRFACDGGEAVAVVYADPLEWRAITVLGEGMQAARYRRRAVEV